MVDDDTGSEAGKGPLVPNDPALRAPPSRLDPALPRTENEIQAHLDAVWGQLRTHTEAMERLVAEAERRDSQESPEVPTSDLAGDSSMTEGSDRGRDDGH